MSTTAPSFIPDETLGDRMRRALRKEHMSVQDMADFLGVARNTVSTWINDRIHPSEQTLKLWAIRTGVPLEWLKHGAVSPFPRGLDQTRDTGTDTRQYHANRHDYSLAA